MQIKAAEAKRLAEADKKAAEAKRQAEADKKAAEAKQRTKGCRSETSSSR